MDGGPTVRNILRLTTRPCARAKTYTTATRLDVKRLFLRKGRLAKRDSKTSDAASPATPVRSGTSTAALVHAYWLPPQDTATRSNRTEVAKRP
jgi:hypothetical protein